MAGVAGRVAHGGGSRLDPKQVTGDGTEGGEPAQGRRSAAVALNRGDAIGTPHGHGQRSTSPVVAYLRNRLNRAGRASDGERADPRHRFRRQGDQASRRVAPGAGTPESTGPADNQHGRRDGQPSWREGARRRAAGLGPRPCVGPARVCRVRGTCTDGDGVYPFPRAFQRGRAVQQRVLSF